MPKKGQKQGKQVVLRSPDGGATLSVRVKKDLSDALTLFQRKYGDGDMTTAIAVRMILRARLRDEGLLGASVPDLPVSPSVRREHEVIESTVYGSADRFIDDDGEEIVIPPHLIETSPGHNKVLPGPSVYPERNSKCVPPVVPTPGEGNKP